MSILDFPRLNFKGIFKTNPCTANNDDVEPSVVTRDTNDLGPDLANMDDDQVMQYLGTAVKMNNYSDQPSTPQKTFIQAGWNPYGNHVTTFEQTNITTAVYAVGNSATTPSQDPIVGVKLEIIGKPTPSGSNSSAPVIVDLDPTGLVTTQLFVGGIRLTYMGSNGQPNKLEILYDTRAYQNWLNFFSTVPQPNQDGSAGSYGGEQDFVGIACMWQFAIPASSLPDTPGLNSRALQMLFAEAKAKGGLAVRFRCLEMEPGLTADYLNYQIQQGQFPPNPAYGYVVGTIGVWGDSEPQTEPAGRKLEAHYRASSPQQRIVAGDPDKGRPAMSWATGPVGVGKPFVQTLPGGEYPWWSSKLGGASPPPALIGNVVVSVRQNPAIISLDLLETFPKLGFRNPNGPQMPANLADPAVVPQGFDKPKQMAYVGDVELAVIPAGGNEAAAITITPIDYGFGDYGKYENWGGIVDVPYAPILYQTIVQGQLILRGSNSNPAQVNAGVTLVKETLIRVITDDRTAYIPFPHNPPDVMPPSYPFHVKVYERGGPTTRDVTLYINEYKSIVQLKTTPKSQEQCVPASNNQFRTNQSVGSRTDTLTDQSLPLTCPPNDDQAEPPRLLFPQSVTIPAGTTSWTPIMLMPNKSSGGGAAVLAIQPEQNYLYGTIPPSTQGGTYTVGVAGVPMWSNATYSSVRVYEEEDFSALYSKPGGLQWPDVYVNALRYYALIFPAMSAIMPLNSSSSITSPYNANSILQRLNVPGDPLFLTTLNMPVTRTMSPSRVKLIKDFIQQQTQQRL